MKVKELLALLEELNPEAIVTIPKGFVEDGTSRIEVFEEYGQIVLQEKQQVRR